MSSLETMHITNITITIWTTRLSEQAVATIFVRRSDCAIMQHMQKVFIATHIYVEERPDISRSLQFRRRYVKATNRRKLSIAITFQFMLRH